MYASSLVKPAANQPARTAAFTFMHVVVFLLCWFPLNPLVLNLCRILVHDGFGSVWEVADNRQFFGLVSASILGPYTAAVEGRNREFCLDAALRFLPWCAAAVGIGVLIQYVWRPSSRTGQGVRLSLWAAGWLVWFAGAFVSILNNSG